MRDSFIFYASFAKAIKRRPEPEQLKALWAIIDYGLDGIEPEDDGSDAAYMSIFEMAQPQIDANIKRKADGAKGGRPVKHTNKEETSGYEDEKPVVKKKKVDSPEDNSPVVGYIPLVDGTEYAVTENALEEWQKLYPAIDAKQELRSLIGWNKANPTHKKTRAGINRHLNSWFSRAQNSAKKVGQQKKQNSFCNFEQRDTDYDSIVNNSVKEWIGGDA